MYIAYAVMIGYIEVEYMFVVNIVFSQTKSKKYEVFRVSRRNLFNSKILILMKICI